MKTIFNNKFLEFNFILFPIWILPVYFILKVFFPSPEIPFLIFLILFGETFLLLHFFFFNKPNYDYIKKYIFISCITYFISCFIFFFGLKYFEYAILLGAIASGLHVTRQSIGVSRLYSIKRNQFYELLIYFSSFLFLFLGFLRFYFEQISFGSYEVPIFILKIVDKILLLTNNTFLSFTLVLILSLLALSDSENYKKKLINLTGVLIYCPYLFVNNIYDAIIVGVGAHWSQYLLINYKVYFYNQKMNHNKILQLMFIFCYALIMSFLGYAYHFDKNVIQILILIPLSGQFFHYIIDAFIWRFSIKEIRENIGSKLFA